MAVKGPRELSKKPKYFRGTELRPRSEKIALDKRSIRREFARAKEKRIISMTEADLRYHAQRWPQDVLETTIKQGLNGITRLGVIIRSSKNPERVRAAKLEKIGLEKRLRILEEFYNSDTYVRAKQKESNRREMGEIDELDRSKMNTDASSDRARRERLQEIKRQADEQSQIENEKNEMWEKRRKEKAAQEEQARDRDYPLAVRERDAELNNLLSRFRELALSKKYDITKLAGMTRMFADFYKRDPIKAKAMMIRVLETRKPELILPGDSEGHELIDANKGGKGPRRPAEQGGRNYPIEKYKGDKEYPLAVRDKTGSEIRVEVPTPEERSRAEEERRRIVENTDEATRDAEEAENQRRTDMMRRRNKNVPEDVDTAIDGLAELGATKEDIEELKRLMDLGFEANRKEFSALNRKLDELSSRLKPEALEAFGEFLKIIVTASFKLNQKELIVAIIKRFDEEYPILKQIRARFDYIDQVLYDMKKQNAKDVKEIKSKLLEIYDEIEKIKTGQEIEFAKIVDMLNELDGFLHSDAFSKIIKDACLEAFKAHQTDLIDAIMAEFDKKYPDLKDMKSRFDKLENLIADLESKGIANTDKLLSQMEEYYRDLLIDNYSNKEEIMDMLQDALVDLAQRGEENKEEILDRLWEVFVQGKKNTKEVMDKLEELKQYFSSDVFEGLLKTIVGQAVEDNNPKLIQAMKDAGFLTEEGLKKILDERDKKPVDGDKADKDTNTDKDTRPVEAPKKSKWPARIGAGAFWIIIAVIIAALMYAIKTTPSNSTSNVAPIQTVPIIAGAAKTATTSSILGSLGGINPIIIVLVLVALFLLFPKK